MEVIRHAASCALGTLNLISTQEMWGHFAYSRRGEDRI
jgi:hypothetical protein